MSNCDLNDSCRFDKTCENYFNCIEVDPKGLELMLLNEKVTELEKRISALEARNN